MEIGFLCVCVYQAMMRLRWGGKDGSPLIYCRLSPFENESQR